MAPFRRVRKPPRSSRSDSLPPNSASGLFGRVYGVLNWIPSRPVLLVVFLLLSNYLGFNKPLLWSFNDNAPLLTPFFFPPKLFIPGNLGAGSDGPGGAGPGSGDNEAAQFERELFEDPLDDSVMGYAEASGEGEEMGEMGQRGTRGPGSEDEPHPVRESGSGQSRVSGEGEGEGADGRRRARAAELSNESGSSRARLGGQSTLKKVRGHASANASMGKAGEGVARRGGRLKSERRSKYVAKEGDFITPYVAPHDIDMNRVPECGALVPAAALDGLNSGPITDLRSLDAPRRRALVILPRYGLGNSLRGFVSAFVYAYVSRRKVVRFHGAEHSKVFDTLCSAFNCGFNSIHWTNETGPRALYQQLNELNPFPMAKSSKDIRMSIADDVAVMLCRSPSLFDGFWMNYPGVQACVHKAFACSSVWCVHSRALHGLLRGPSKVLKRAIRSFVRKYIPGPKQAEEPDGTDVAATTERAGVIGGTEGASVPVGAKEGSTAGVPGKGQGEMNGIDSMFDVAVHMRTRTAAIESLKGGPEELSRVECTDPKPAKGEKGAKKPKHQFLKACLWSCLGGLIQGLDRSRRKVWERKGEPPPKLSIFLSTDNEALRPVFVARLSAYGDVYFSQGSIVHLSKSASSDLERMPTMVEFYMMAKSHTVIEAGSYLSTFAYFAALYGNGTLAAIDWVKQGGCELKVVHRAELAPSRAASQTHQ